MYSYPHWKTTVVQDWYSQASHHTKIGSNCTDAFHDFSTTTVSGVGTARRSDVDHLIRETNEHAPENLKASPLATFKLLKVEKREMSMLVTALSQSRKRLAFAMRCDPWAWICLMIQFEECKDTCARYHAGLLHESAV